jgi:hypothetical protein
MKAVSEVGARAHGFVRELVDRFGPRLTGTDACLNAADHIATAFGEVSHRSWTEDFAVHPRAFLGWIRLLIITYIMAVVLFWLRLPVASAVVMTGGLSIMVLEFFFYREVIDPFYPKRKGRNVIGVIEPVGSVERQVYVTGHHDSAHVFTFYLRRPEWYPVRIIGGIGVFALAAVAAWIWAGYGGAAGTVAVQVLRIGATAFVPFVAHLWFFASPTGTPGAGDNLAAVAIAREVGRHFSAEAAAGRGLVRTRVVVASWDAEEAGLRGARRFAERHRQEFQAVPTWNLNADCPYRLEDLCFLASDVNGTVQLSNELAAECAGVAKALGYRASVKPIEFLTGGTDAGELARVGASATTLMGMPWGNAGRASVYHTPADTPEAVDPAVLEAGFRIFAEVIRRIDAGACCA